MESINPVLVEKVRVQESKPTFTVLVVDDESINLSTLANFLHQQQQQVLVANSGEKALKIAKARRPDVIVLDIEMPDMNGIEVCRRLRQDDELAETKVIFLSASDREQATALELGNGFILKPFEPDLLLEQLGLT